MCGVKALFLKISQVVDESNFRGKLKEWRYVYVYICPKCDCVRIWWIDEMHPPTDTMRCVNTSCSDRMKLRLLTMEEARRHTNTWRRIEDLSARGF